MKKLLVYFVLACLIAGPVSAQQTRTEQNLLGAKQIPADKQRPSAPQSEAWGD